MLPCATLQTLCWVVAAAWLRRDVPGAVPTLPWLGLAVGIALMLYATFLGSEGRTYELLRRYGTVIYFGGTGLALLVALRALSRNRSALRLPRLARDRVGHARHRFGQCRRGLHRR